MGMASLIVIGTDGRERVLVVAIAPDRRAEIRNYVERRYGVRIVLHCADVTNFPS